MSGQDGNRGYLIQSVIALLDSLNRSDWDRLTLEPSHASEKIDITWHGATLTRACQVKSSINQFNRPDVELWAADLEKQSDADVLELVLVGSASSSVIRMERHGRVAVPCPKNLDIEGLLGLAAHLLDKFLVSEKIRAQSPSHRELMVRGLVTELSVLASSGDTIERPEFVGLLKTWTQAVEPPANLMWEQIDFSHQRGIENAIAGNRLGPSDVDQCPEFPICEQVVEELNRSHWYSIVGKQGCGKSITAWHAAKRFHDRCYSVWRPHCSAETRELLTNLPTAGLSLLVIDDAQQYDLGFVERLCERSCKTLKIIFTSTLADVVVPNPYFISPKSGVDQLKISMLERRQEILPIVQRWDGQVGDSYGDRSFEDRIYDCARQETPWAFFWVLRGGWQTVRGEYENLKQMPNANMILTTIAVRQISTCDAGLSQDGLTQAATEIGLTPTETDRVITHLVSLGLVLISDGVFRTKHVNYADSVFAESLRNENSEMSPHAIKAFVTAALDDKTTLQGVYWLFDAFRMTEVARFGDLEQIRPILEPILARCRREWRQSEWRQSEWAVGCASWLFSYFDFSLERILLEKQLLLEWFVAGTGRIARFACGIANHLINGSDRDGKPETTDVAKSLFEEVDFRRLVDLANSVTLDDFYNFGDLLDRLAFYRPAWSEEFLASFDWQRALKIILSATANQAHAVDQLVGGITVVGSADRRNLNLKYLEDCVPFVVRAIGEDPTGAIEALHYVFWHCLGYAPRFLRSHDPNERQKALGRRIISHLNPADFANSMSKVVSRDLENLARSFSVIHEIDPEFIPKIAPLISEDDFLAATQSDWRNQSSELQHLLPYFCIGVPKEPACEWVSRNERFIQGPLQPMLAGIAPQVALRFHQDGKQVSLVGHRQDHWNQTVWAITRIANVDNRICIEIVTEQFPVLEASLYDLTTGETHFVVLFFRSLFELSNELYEDFVARLDVDDPRAIETINGLIKSKQGRRTIYEKLARIAHRVGGSIGALGDKFMSRLNAETARLQHQ